MRKKRVRTLGWKVSTFLSAEEIQSLAGRGTSFFGTGSIDSQGRAQDLAAGDCIEGQDVYFPRH